MTTRKPFTPAEIEAASTEAIVSLRERVEGAEKELTDIATAIGTVRFTDPPDGGDVTPAEQVRRMRAALDEAERYPTVEAYEAACRALEKHRTRAAALEGALHVLSYQLDTIEHERDDAVVAAIRNRFALARRWEVSQTDKDRISHAALSASPAPAVRRVRHLKRGTTYDVLGDLEMQIAIPERGVRIVREGDHITVYRSDENGKLYGRFPDEFEDGRFVDVERGEG